MPPTGKSGQHFKELTVFSVGLFLSLKVTERKGVRSGWWGRGDCRLAALYLTHLKHCSVFWCNNAVSVSWLVLPKALSHQDKAGGEDGPQQWLTLPFAQGQPSSALARLLRHHLCHCHLFSFGILGLLFQKCCFLGLGFIFILLFLYSVKVSGLIIHWKQNQNT